MALTTKHLLGIKDLTQEDIQLILSTASQFKEVLQRPVKKVPTLRDVTIVNLFYENSTRTRISFELAEKRLSADVVNFTVSNSSAAKGETLLDTVNNILSMKVDMVVMRHRCFWSAPLSRKAYRCGHYQCRRWYQRTSHTGFTRCVFDARKIGTISWGKSGHHR
jgi:aspartate carbamoyltransferase catalytic subunit